MTLSGTSSHQLLLTGIAAAGLIAISLCLTVTILEMIKLNKQAKEEERKKKERRDAQIRLGRLQDSHRSLHAAQV